MSKVTDLLKKAESSPQWCNAASYLIIDMRELRSGDRRMPPGSMGKIKVWCSTGDRGTVSVFLWDCIGTPLQSATCSGWGYDKTAQCLSQLTFDEIKLGDNWKDQLCSLGYDVIRTL